MRCIIALGDLVGMFERRQGLDQRLPSPEAVCHEPTIQESCSIALMVASVAEMVADSGCRSRFLMCCC